MGTNGQEGEMRNVGHMLHEALQEVGPLKDGVLLGKDEMDALSQLFMMAFVPTGKEDPRALLSRMPDELVTHVVTRLEQVKKNPAVAQICQFFLIEWCYRNGYLNGDWLWKWEGPRRGDLHYNPRIPLSMVPLPTQAAGGNRP